MMTGPRGPDPERPDEKAHEHGDQGALDVIHRAVRAVPEQAPAKHHRYHLQRLEQALHREQHQVQGLVLRDRGQEVRGCRVRDQPHVPSDDRAPLDREDGQAQHRACSAVRRDEEQREAEDLAVEIMRGQELLQHGVDAEDRVDAQGTDGEPPGVAPAEQAMRAPRPVGYQHALVPLLFRPARGLARLLRGRSAARIAVGPACAACAVGKAGGEPPHRADEHRGEYQGRRHLGEASNVVLEEDGGNADSDRLASRRDQGKHHRAEIPYSVRDHELRHRGGEGEHA
mmetsp:Transcript_84915/g.259272  ORF Transcript_84915/g.259272 Transcript_84915/m.259272 type:complete len:285 (-) Transcript_84915:1170-2024(-)